MLESRGDFAPTAGSVSMTPSTGTVSSYWCFDRRPRSPAPRARPARRRATARRPSGIDDRRRPARHDELRPSRRRSTNAPGAGCCAITMPFGSSALRSTIVQREPGRARRASVAFAWAEPDDRRHRDGARLGGRRGDRDPATDEREQDGARSPTSRPAAPRRARAGGASCAGRTRLVDDDRRRDAARPGRTRSATTARSAWARRRRSRRRARRARAVAAAAAHAPRRRARRASWPRRDSARPDRDGRRARPPDRGDRARAARRSGVCVRAASVPIAVSATAGTVPVTDSTSTTASE